MNMISNTTNFLDIKITANEEELSFQLLNIYKLSPETHKEKYRFIARTSVGKNCYR